MANDRIERDRDRSRRLLFSVELADGVVRPSQLARAEVRDAVQTRRFPSPLSRGFQRRLMARGGLAYEDETLARFVAARRAVLGADADGPPRLLLRMGAFPHPLADDDPARFGIDAFRRVHDRLAAAGVPYLLAVTPRVSHRPLDPRADGSRPLSDAERDLLAQLRREGVVFAAHGLDHRTRRRSARRRSELAGLNAKAVGERLDLAAAELAEAAIRPEIFVPPFERFDWRQWEQISRRFTVVTAGHDSVDALGFHDGPLWRGEAVWLPVYAPFAGVSDRVAPAAEQLVRAQAAVWAGLHLDWSREADGDGLERLIAGAGRAMLDWSTFLAAVNASTVDPVSHLGSEE